jgi:hypothetical protein
MSDAGDGGLTMTDSGERPFRSLFDGGVEPPGEDERPTRRLWGTHPATPGVGNGEVWLGRFLATAAVGVVLFIAALALDAWLHAREPALAAREGLFSLGNPAHALFLVGVLLTASGVVGAGWVLLQRGSDPGRAPGNAAVGSMPRTALLGVAVVAVVGLTAVAGWASSMGDGHDHGGTGAQAGHAAAGTATSTVDPHPHRHDPAAAVAEATPEQRAAAQALLDASIAAAARWRDPAAARRDGYRVNLGKLTSGETRFLHAGNPSLRDDGGTLDPRHPESVIYAKGPDGAPVLVGVLYVAPPGQHGPTPGGPITSWHSHAGCVDPATGRRQPLPKRAGACPDGLERRDGPEMMHVWFTDRLETAFARRAPGRALPALRRASGGTG